MSKGQRHPNQKSPFDFTQGRKKTTPREDALVVRQEDLKSLQATQAARPAKPPGRR